MDQAQPGDLLGSSPLARGLLTATSDSVFHTGIIPARAGFTVFDNEFIKDHRDHPRSRGVYAFDSANCLDCDGSSPLARGLRSHSGMPRNRQGIIPARAGFTELQCSYHPQWADHPRSRGVYRSPLVTVSPTAGSSPLARGLLTATSDSVFHTGIIPARAGFTVFDNEFIKDHRDHPRSRGVYAFDSANCLDCDGSSPLARGLRSHSGMPRNRQGIIPARAGFTELQCSYHPQWADHPRSRGVYLTGNLGYGNVRGSSPLARGLLFREIIVIE